MTIIRFSAALALAFLLGKLVARIRLPAILGWLLAGFILGPHMVGLITEGVLRSTWYALLLPLANLIVGVMLGTNLVYDKIKGKEKKLITISLIQLFVTFLVTSGAFALLFLSMGVPVLLSLIIGVIAIATAPAPPLSVIEAYQTDGPLTRTVVPLTILNDLVTMVIVFTMVSVLQSNFAESSGSLVLTLLNVILLPVVLGILAGWLSVKIMQQKRRPAGDALIFFSVLLLLYGLALVLDHQVLAAPAMNFLLLGIAYAAVFGNSLDNERAEDLFDKTNPFETAGLLILFVHFSAPLDYRLLLQAGLLPFFYLLVRLAGKYLGGFAGASVAGSRPAVRNFLGLTMLPHAGISILYAGMAAGAISLAAPDYADLIMIIIPAAALINEILAIILSRKAYDWAGEIGHQGDEPDEALASSNYRRLEKSDAYYFIHIDSRVKGRKL